MSEVIGQDKSFGEIIAVKQWLLLAYLDNYDNVVFYVTYIAMRNTILNKKKH